MRVLHVAPHPDDEALGAPATLLALRDAGWEVVNLCCSLGRPGHEARRARELAEACRRAAFQSLTPADGAVAEVLADGGGFDLVVSPSEHDRHPAHERVAAEVRAALGAGAAVGRWWRWGLWGALPDPTLALPFGEERLAEAERVLGAHAGELARNDFRRLLRGRAMANAVLAAELLFGFGSPGLGAEYAELLSELVRGEDGTWRLGEPRVLDPARPLG